MTTPQLPPLPEQSMTHHITDEQIYDEWVRQCQATGITTRTLVCNFARAILALRPQSESEARRAAQEQLYTERERHTSEVKRLQAEIGRLQAETAEPFGYFRSHLWGWEDCSEHDEGAKALYERPQAAPKLIGWRTENFLWETGDIDKARNWEPNIGVLPVFEGDPNTKLGSRGITDPAGGEVA